MEAHILSAFTHRAGVKCSIVCVAIVNRLGGDLILASEKTLRTFLRELEPPPTRFLTILLIS